MMEKVLALKIPVGEMAETFTVTMYFDVEGEVVDKDIIIDKQFAKSIEIVTLNKLFDAYEKQSWETGG